MKTISTSIPHSKKSNASALSKPMLISLSFFLAVVILRYAEIYIPLFNTLPDKTIASKILGFLLVFGYLWMLRKPLSAIGFKSKNIDKAFLIGGLGLIILYITLYTIQFIQQRNADQSPSLVFAAINKETASMGSLYFTLFLIIGQVINAIMEESIFRGVVFSHLMQRFKAWHAIILQAFLFGLAHLVWPLNDWVSGRASMNEAIGDAGMLLIATTLGGIVFGYLYYRTGNLWTAIIAHFVDNAAGLFFHIQTVNRLNAESDILMIASLGFLSLIFIAWIVSSLYNIPTLEPWKSD